VFLLHRNAREFTCRQGMEETKVQEVNHGRISMVIVSQVGLINQIKLMYHFLFSNGQESGKIFLL